MSKEKYKTLSAVYLLLMNTNAEIVMIRRFNTGYQDGNYTLPSGHIEENETAMDSMIREAKEEINIDVRKSDLKMVHVIHRKSLDRVYFDFYFLCKNWSGEIENVEPQKCDDLSWFNVKSLPTNTIPDVKHAISHVDSDEFCSELGW